jgi:uncharacterized membrane protein
MTTTRLEAFSDGVIAILITIMILDLKLPEGFALRAPDGSVSWSLLLGTGIVAKLLIYILSYLFLGIYWSNHHHMLQVTEQVNGKILWANLHLLFWLSLVPFVTSWLGTSHGDPIPTALYGLVLLLAGQAYVILQNAIIALQGPGSPLAAAVGRDRKGLMSRVLYLTAIAAAFVAPWVSDLLYAAVAAMWLVPDRRIESSI